LKRVHDSPSGTALLEEIEKGMERLRKIIGDKTHKGTFAEQAEKLKHTQNVQFIRIFS
jgi:hypothetical protein